MRSGRAAREPAEKKLIYSKRARTCNSFRLLLFIVFCIIVAWVLSCSIPILFYPSSTCLLLLSLCWSVSSSLSSDLATRNIHLVVLLCIFISVHLALAYACNRAEQWQQVKIIMRAHTIEETKRSQQNGNKWENSVHALLVALIVTYEMNCQSYVLHGNCKCLSTQHTHTECNSVYWALAYYTHFTVSRLCR